MPVADQAAAGGTPPILFGADPIGEFLFPDEPQRRRQRRVRRLISEVPIADRLPTFKLGGTVCARPSTLLAWLAEREGRGDTDAAMAEARCPDLRQGAADEPAAATATEALIALPHAG